MSYFISTPTLQTDPCFLLRTLFGFVILNVSFPSPSRSLYNNLSLSLTLSPAVSSSLSSSLFLHPLRAAGAGGCWQVAAVLCLSACRRLPTCVCSNLCECECTCAGRSLHMFSFVPVCVCAPAPVCPALIEQGTAEESSQSR